jgi:hypothetical protein
LKTGLTRAIVSSKPFSLIDPGQCAETIPGFKVLSVELIDAVDGPFDQLKPMIDISGAEPATVIDRQR